MIPRLNPLHLPFYLVLSLVLWACGTNSGIDPHLSLDEVEQLTEINLVGKWKIRRPSSFKLDVGLKNNTCTIEEIEFFSDGGYLLIATTQESNGEEKKIYRGNYGVAYTENNDEYTLNRIVLMDANYTLGNTVPQTGTIATLTELDLSSTDISFTAVLGEGTQSFCSEGSAISLSGEKSEPVAPEADETSNHALLTQTWRLTQISATVEGVTDPNGTTQNVCYFFEQERENRCDDGNGTVASNCPYAASLTLLISEYGTYLFTYYGFSGEVLTEELGDWRWRTTSPMYTEFEVKEPNETFESSDTVIYIRSISETTLTLREISEEEDEEGNLQTIYLDYNFQLASLAFQYTDCTAIDE